MSTASQSEILKENRSAHKVFLSYSWTSQEHESWVIQLAGDLVESGIDVVLDKWELREGADKYAFMEKMVNDPEVTKVLMICDRAYAEKADKREGGVGSETQIISPEIYEQFDAATQKQKFIPVVTEKDENGRPYVPHYLKSRIHVDMSDPNRRSDTFEQLVRSIYGKPLFQKPELGRTPAYILAEDRKTLGTSARFQRALEAVRSNKEYAVGAVEEYFELFVDNLEEFRIHPTNDAHLDDLVFEGIASFKPYTDEAIELFSAIGRFRGDTEIYGSVHRFFESLLPYLYKKVDTGSWIESEFDNFKFIINELFICAIAIFIKHNRFEAVNEILETGYFPPRNYPYGTVSNLFSFQAFCQYLESFRVRNARLSLRRTSLKADLMKERATRREIGFEEMLQVELLLFLRDELHTQPGNRPLHHFYPELLVFVQHRMQPFEIFLRAESSKYLKNILMLLGITSTEPLLKLFAEFRNGERELPSFNHFRMNPQSLANLENLGTRL